MEKLIICYNLFMIVIKVKHDDDDEHNIQK